MTGALVRLIGRLVVTVAVLMPRPAIAQDPAWALDGLLEADPFAGGRRFVEHGCGHCHGSGAIGATDLTRAGMRLSLLDLAGEMWNHAMTPAIAAAAPAPGDEADMADLFAFLYGYVAPGRPGDPDRGAKQFADLGCGTCHAVGARAADDPAAAGPALDHFGDQASPLVLAAALWTVRPMPDHPSPVFAPGERADLAAFLRRATGATVLAYGAPGAPDAGADLFWTLGCAGCHAVGGAGGGGGDHAGPDLGARRWPHPAALTDAIVHHRPEVWAASAATGGAPPELLPEDLGDLVAWLTLIPFVDAPGDPARGATTYRDKRCADCHETRPGRGAPPPATLAAAMARHRPDPERTTVGAWSRLRPGDMADLAALFAAPEVDPADLIPPPLPAALDDWSVPPAAPAPTPAP